MLWFPPPCFIPCGHLRRDPVWSSSPGLNLLRTTVFNRKNFIIFTSKKIQYISYSRTLIQTQYTNQCFWHTRTSDILHPCHLRQTHSPRAFPNRQHTAQSNERWWSPVCPACGGSGILPVKATAVSQLQQQPQPTGEALMPSRAHLETKGQGVFARSICCSALESDPTPMEPDLQAFQDQQENRPRYSIFQCS